MPIQPTLRQRNLLAESTFAKTSIANPIYPMILPAHAHDMNRPYRPPLPIPFNPMILAAHAYDLNRLHRTADSTPW